MEVGLSIVNLGVDIRSHCQRLRVGLRANFYTKSKSKTIFKFSKIIIAFANFHNV